MISTAVAAFLGCFAAIVTLGEFPPAPRWIRFLGAFLVGLVVTVLLSALLSWLVVHVFGRLGAAAG